MNSIFNIEYILYLAVFTGEGNLVVEMRCGHSDSHEEQTGLVQMCFD